MTGDRRGGGNDDLRPNAKERQKLKVGEVDREGKLTSESEYIYDRIGVGRVVPRFPGEVVFMNGSTSIVEGVSRKNMGIISCHMAVGGLAGGKNIKRKKIFPRVPKN